MIPSTYKVFQRVYWGQELLKKIEVCKTTPPTAPPRQFQGDIYPYDHVSVIFGNFAKFSIALPSGNVSVGRYLPSFFPYLTRCYLSPAYPCRRSSDVDSPDRQR